eukprot:Phypoly_transcript_16411.p1 GENE.Phypoly_transcript_16411~~Phypoly_transcript_16411.p1  ORF type:complete len:272 (+),score=62.49 Phypoly_transcript_16411:83-817(+)
MSEANKYKIDDAQAAALKEKVEALRSGITEKAYHLVHIVMPQRVLALSELYNTMPEMNEELAQVHSFDIHATSSSEQGDAKKRKTAGGEAVEGETKVVPCNKAIVDLIVVVKKNILQLIEAINCVKIWIQLNIPKIEDGNNFGVSIQEETVGELGRAEDSGYALLENLSKYFVARAKLVSKVMKYPTIQDYKKSVQELDEKEYLNLKLSCLDLRNNYAILFDMITKNMDKIRAPRPTSHLNSMF